MGRSWHRLMISAPTELRLRVTFENGQCFGWTRQPGDDPVWIGVLGQRVLAVRETESDCLFRCLGELAETETATATIRDELHDYFQLGTPLAPLVDAWGAADGEVPEALTSDVRERMNVIARTLPGMRVLRQDPEECLFSFICSSNNNIKRIGGMLQSIRQQYGTKIPLAMLRAEVPSEQAAYTELSAPVGHGGAADFYTFPSAAAIAAASEEELRKLGLGYRAPYLRQTAQRLTREGASWLKSLRMERDPNVVRATLMELPGVGTKVADSVALFSLDQHSCVPVDVHVWEIACREFDPTLAQEKSLTPKVYARVGEQFRRAYGSHAGWAHSVLFAAELPAYREQLPEAMRQKMAIFAEQEREKKAVARAEKKARAEAKAEIKDEDENEMLPPDDAPATAPLPASTATKPPRKRSSVVASAAAASAALREASSPTGTTMAGRKRPVPEAVD